MITTTKWVCIALLCSHTLAAQSDITVMTYIQGGRITVYGLLGVFAGLMGKGFTLAGGHQLLAILLGGAITLIGLSELLKQYRLPINLSLLNLVENWLLKKHAQLKAPTTFIKGMLNGLLPCGLVYVALAGAMISDGLIEGFIYMVLFGLGTTPILLFIILFGPINKKFRSLPLQKILPWVTLLFGLWILVRGLGLDIPFWSPEVGHLNLSNEMRMEHHH